MIVIAKVVKTSLGPDHQDIGVPIGTEVAVDIASACSVDIGGKPLRVAFTDVGPAMPLDLLELPPGTILPDPLPTLTNNQFMERQLRGLSNVTELMTGLTNDLRDKADRYRDRILEADEL